jgi:hypothetical protein
MENPTVPSDVRAEISEDGKLVRVVWKGDEKRAAGYLVQWRKQGNTGPGGNTRNENGEEDLTMDMDKCISCDRLPAAPGKCEFWVVAVNGELESEQSKVVTAK